MDTRGTTGDYGKRHGPPEDPAGLGVGWGRVSDRRARRDSRLHLADFVGPHLARFIQVNTSVSNLRGKTPQGSRNTGIRAAICRQSYDSAVQQERGVASSVP